MKSFSISVIRLLDCRKIIDMCSYITHQFISVMKLITQCQTKCRRFMSVL